METVCHIEVAGDECSDGGRYLKAAKDIKKGEIILSDYPLVAGMCSTLHYSD